MPFFKLSEQQSRELIPGIHVRFVHSEKMTFAYWELAAGAAIPEHSHIHEQVANVIEGEFELTIDGEKQLVSPGIVGVIPSNAVHSGIAITTCRILDVFFPVREDYRK
jgi:quercetin dioxygenase-like cupin family protein